MDQLTKNALSVLAFKLRNRKLSEHLDFGSLDKTENITEPENCLFMNIESVKTIKEHSKFKKVTPKFLSS